MNQTKQKMGKPLVTYAFNCIKSVTYIYSLHRVGRVQNLYWALKECKLAVLIMTEKWFFKFIACFWFSFLNQQY